MPLWSARPESGTSSPTQSPESGSGRAEPGLTPGETLISMRSVEKSYPHGVGRTYVLRRVNVDIKEGEFGSIMGPSGAGKSTLLHSRGMRDSAWSGEYYFMAQPVHRLNPKQRSELHKKHIGFVFQ